MAPILLKQLWVLFAVSVLVAALEKRCSLLDPQNPDVLLIEIRALNEPGSRQIMAYGPNYEQGCTSTDVSYVVNGNTVNINSLDILYDMGTELQTQPNPTTDNCYIQTNQQLARIGLTIVLQQDAGFIQVTDLFFLIFCDLDNLDAGFQDVAPTDVSLNNVNPSVQPDQSETFTMRLVRSSDQTPVTEVQLGESVYLQMTYTKPSTVSGEWPIGVHNFLVTVRHEDMDIDSAIVLIDGDGCVNLADTNAQAFRLEETFSWYAENSVGTVYHFKTGDFEVAMIRGGNSLLFRGHYKAECFSITETKCFNQNEYCLSLGGGRKRRSTPTDLDGIYDLAVNVKTPRSSSNDISNEEKFERLQLYWVMSLVFCMLLLLVACLAACLFCCLRREVSSRRHIEQNRKQDKLENFYY